ncbi:type I-E CRISPR-associated protein Cse1/CasA, partial [Psychrobacter sp.]|uniref:type I-E CRISPR-associated protein Cse1/CasA n=1 Tax=Psychrobacter sp. TaxID=56811 RepID=UPI0025CE3522
MNIITDAWLPVVTQDGQKTKITLAQLSDPNIKEIDFPRLDFQGAGYQLLIGLLQTTFAPSDREQWINLYESPPSAEALQNAFHPVIHAFSLTGDGVAKGARFMQ